MITDKVEIQNNYDKMLVMTRMGDGRLLQLNGTYVHTHTAAYLSHHDLGIMPSSILWHARLGHINYESLHLLRNNGVSGLPTIPRKMKSVMLVYLESIENNLYMIPLPEHVENLN